MSFTVFKGLILAILSGVCLALASVFVKQTKHLHPGQLSVYRFIAITSMCLPETVKCGENPFGPKDLRLLLMLRGILGATNIFLSFLAYRYLPLGEAAAIIFSAPVFITVAAKIFFNDPCGASQSVIVVLTVIGIILTAKVPARLSMVTAVDTKENIYGFIAAIGTVVFSTCRFILMRKVRSCHHAVILFNSSWVAILHTAFLTAILGNFKWQQCGMQGLYIIIFGFLSYVGQTLLTIALQCELAGPVSTMRAGADIGMAFLLQTVLFREIPDALSIVGALLIGISVVSVGLHKWISLMPKESDEKKKLTQKSIDVRKYVY